MSVSVSTEKSLFLEALEFETRAERAAFLDRACSGDRQLRAAVEALLGAHERSQGLLDATASPLGDERPGTRIGPYKILQQIGEGGMGIVYMAEQTEPVHRKVALKVIKAGMDSRQVVARFEAERQALALMDHVNIARVLDAGDTESSRHTPCAVAGEDGTRSVPTTWGRPYFVMELVHGVPITKYCDDNRLSVRERLELFVPVCQAIQHAHQKGIIHRDIKPSNVMITLYDGKPVPKVIDFGVAKAIEQKLTERTLFTQYGMLVGTLEYMSPEQAEMSALGADTRSDVYSLGVLLYELLTGGTPISHQRLKAAPYDEVVRMIREDEPPRPSTRLSGSGAALATISAQRQTEPARLTKLVRGELDWIVMKCLEKDRNRRYDSAASLAADVRRYLNDEAVQACPPSVVYRLGKFARRNKAASAVAIALLLALAVSATGTLVIAWQQGVTAAALEAETEAREELRRDSYFHLIALAHRELSVNNRRRALDLLPLCPEEHRSWEWHYLMRLCWDEPIILQDTTEVSSLSFHPNGETIASGGSDGAIKIWSCNPPQKLRTLEAAHARFVSTVAFHPQGEILASVGGDQEVKVWDLARGEKPVFVEHCNAAHVFGTAYAAAFRPPDGSQLGAGSDGAVQLWDWQNGSLVNTFAEHEQRPANVAYYSRLNVAFSRDGRELAFGSWRGSVKLWNVEAKSGAPLASFDDTRQPISALAFSREGSLATASFDRRVDVWDTATGKLLHRLRHDGLVTCVAFSPDGKRIATGGEDKIVHIWDVATGREVLSLRGHTGQCGCVAFSSDGLRLASSSADRTIRVWDATPLPRDQHDEARTFSHHNNEVWSLAVSPDGTQVVSAGFGMPAKVWDLQTGRVSATFAAHTMVEFCVAWHPDGKRIASAGLNRDRFTVKVWDARTKDIDFELAAGEEFFAVAFSPDGRYLVTGGADRTVRIWDAKTGEGGRPLGAHRGVVRGVVFSRDGRHLASLSADGQVKLWDATRLEEGLDLRHTLPVRVHGPCVNVAFSPDGERLATGGPENTVILWDVESGQELHILSGHNGDIYTVAFSPDGRWLASAGEDSMIKIWDSHAGTLVRTLRGHTGLVSSVAFTPDGWSLISGSRDHKVKVWDATQWEEQPTKVQP